MAVYRGFDVSAYQTNSVPSCDFAFVKATEGDSYTSSKFAAQWASAKDNASVRGAYHFARPEESSATSQADRFLSKVKAVPGEMLCLDLEASDLSQAATNVWARTFGDRIRVVAPGVTTVIYMGGGYATNGTGKDLVDHFDFWWYPQYPKSGATAAWPAFDPWLPAKLTCGWAKPDIWQFTSDFNNLYDASVTTLTPEQLRSGGALSPAPQEDKMSASGVLQSRKNVPNSRSELTLSTKNGACDQIGIWGDPSYDDPSGGYDDCGPGYFRVVAHVKSRRGYVFKDTNTASPTYGTEVISVGFEDDGKGWCDKWVGKLPAGTVADAWKVYRLDTEECQYGADISHS